MKFEKSQEAKKIIPEEKPKKKNYQMSKKVRQI